MFVPERGLATVGHTPDRDAVRLRTLLDECAFGFCGLENVGMQLWGGSKERGTHFIEGALHESILFRVFFFFDRNNRQSKSRFE